MRYTDNRFLTLASLVAALTLVQSLAGCTGPAFSADAAGGGSGGVDAVAGVAGAVVGRGKHELGSGGAAGVSSLQPGSGNGGGESSGGAGESAGGAGPTCLPKTECVAEHCDANSYFPAERCEGDACVAAVAVACGERVCRPGGCRDAVLAYGTPVDTAVRGNVGADTTPFRDVCPAGSVLVGLNARLDQGIFGQLQGVCGIPKISAANPSEVEIAPGEALHWQGGASGTVVSRLCPAHQVVAGFEGRSGLLLDQVQLRCVALQVINGELTAGPLQALEPLGGTGGGPFERTDCPAGSIAVGPGGTTSHWVTAFGLTCTPITLSWRAP